MAWHNCNGANPRRQIPGGFTRIATALSSVPFELKSTGGSSSQSFEGGIDRIATPELQSYVVVDRQGHDPDGSEPEIACHAWEAVLCAARPASLRSTSSSTESGEAAADGGETCDGFEDALVRSSRGGACGAGDHERGRAFPQRSVQT